MYRNIIKLFEEYIYTGELDARLCRICDNLEVVRSDPNVYRCLAKGHAGVYPDSWGYISCDSFNASDKCKPMVDSFYGVLRIGIIL